MTELERIGAQCPHVARMVVDALRHRAVTEEVDPIGHGTCLDIADELERGILGLPAKLSGDPAIRVGVK